MKPLYGCYFITPDIPDGHICKTGMFVDDEHDMEVLYDSIIDMFKGAIEIEFGNNELFDLEGIPLDIFKTKFHEVLNKDYSMAPVVEFKNETKRYLFGVIRFPGY